MSCCTLYLCRETWLKIKEILRTENIAMCFVNLYTNKRPFSLVLHHPNPKLALTAGYEHPAVLEKMCEKGYITVMCKCLHDDFADPLFDVCVCRMG